MFATPVRMMTNAHRSSLLPLLLALTACGPGLIEDVGEAPEEPGEVAVDEGTGAEVTEADPLGAGACTLCDELPMLPVEPEPEPEDAGAEVGPAPVVDAGLADAGVTPPRDAGVRPSPWAPGAKVLTRSYVSFRDAPSSSAALLTAAQPAGGVTDSAHGGGMPRGQLPPGQVAVLVTGTKTNGFYEVRYDGRRGWLSATSLAVVDGAKHPVAFALGATVRNAFFKHQLRRTKWNKDGPLSSGTCAPTSLAMAARVFGKEPAGLSIEESIHRSRMTYGATSDGTGTSRAKITTGATQLGLSVRVLDTRLSTSSMLTRLDQQLAARRVVVLEGQPGIEGAGSTPYQQAFNRAYAAAGLSNRYTFDGRHSILLLGKDATGRYVIGDPISEVGMLAVTAAELKDFFARWGGTGNAVWVP